MITKRTSDEEESTGLSLFTNLNKLYRNQIFGKPFWIICPTGFEWSEKAWVVDSVLTTFGIPWSTVWFSVIGPFKSREAAEEIREKIENGEVDLKRVSK